MTQKLEIFPTYTNRSFDNLYTYKNPTNCDDESCLMYMFKNGNNIYYELDLYNNIPKQVETEKMSNIFNTNNIIKKELLNDIYISEIRNKYDVDDDFVINSILMHLRPILFSDNKQVTIKHINQIKNNVEKRMEFELNYMNTIENQIKFLMSYETKQHIREKINYKVRDLNVEVKDDYIRGILIHEINNFGFRHKNQHKVRPDEVFNIYTSTLSKLKPRDIFTIISDVIERIVSNFKVEHNMIKNNNKLDKWNTILGDHNKHGLRRHDYIKLNEKKPKGMLFNMTF